MTQKVIQKHTNGVFFLSVWLLCFCVFVCCCVFLLCFFQVSSCTFQWVVMVVVGGGEVAEGGGEGGRGSD